MTDGDTAARVEQRRDDALLEIATLLWPIEPIDQIKMAALRQAYSAGWRDSLAEMDLVWEGKR